MRRNLSWLAALLCLMAIAVLLLRPRAPHETAASPAPRTPSVEPVEARRPAHTAAGLPDLVVTEVYWDDPYVRVNYRNDGGMEAPDQADFLVKISAAGREFGGNSHYRFPIPGPGREVSTGGFTIGLVGLEPGMTADVTATIDWEGRVHEANEHNNQLTRRILLEGPTLVPVVPRYNQ
ncbi:MAG: hypothetical protein AB1758_01860 [Candidatus Eremiobacterota bacterium]